MQVADYIDRLDDNTSRLLDTLLQFSSEELLWHAPERWNILEVAEHIMITEELVRKILISASTEKAEVPELFGNEKMHKLLVDYRGRKVKAPANMQLKGQITTVDSFKSALLNSREKIKTGLNDGSLVVDNRVYHHPMLGAMTVSDWLHFLIQHAERHLLQMKDNAIEFRKSKQD